MEIYQWPSLILTHTGILIYFDLQVHKSVVRGRSHLNVSAVMKKVPNEATVKVIALRHQNNMEKIAVKKFTQFPVKLDDVVRKKYNRVSSVMEFFRWWVIISYTFGQKPTHSKEIIVFCE